MNPWLNRIALAVTPAMALGVIAWSGSTTALEATTLIDGSAISMTQDPEYAPGLALTFIQGDRTDTRLARMSSLYVDAGDAPSIMLKHDKHIQNPKRSGRDGEEVDRSKLFHMVVEECAPTLRGWFARANHVLRDRSLADMDAEHLKFAVDSRRTPPIVARHHSNELSNLMWNPWSTAAAAS